MRLLYQVVVCFIVALGIGNGIGGLIELHDNGTFGFQFDPTPAGAAHVRSVTPGGSANRAGIRVNDILNVAPTFANQVILRAPVPGDEIAVTDGNRTVTLRAEIDKTPAPIVLIVAVLVSKLAFLLIALVIALRRADDAAARALGLFLACFGAAIDWDAVLVPMVWARFASAAANQTLFLVGGVSMMAFASRFPVAAERGVRALFNRLAVPFAILGVVLSGVSFAFAFFLSQAPRMLGRYASIAYILLYLVIVVGTLACFIVSFRTSTGEQRVRMRWVLLTFGVGLSGLVAFFISIALGYSIDATQLAALTVLAIPFGLGYVILRHRVLDITFVINRAVVYGSVSLIMITTFIIFEWIVGNVVQRGTGESLVFNVVGAIVLGFSVRYIHDRVDKRIDDLFFRERHLAEAAIRRFAHEAALITETNDLMQKTVEVAQRNVKLNGAAFYAYDDGMFAPRFSSLEQAPLVSENDYAVLDMRGFHKPVDLMNFDSAIAGDYAFPMMVRGALAGFLACGPKLSHEALAPDERDALAVLARDCGIALDSLRVHHIERELADARATIAALVATPTPQLPRPQL